MPVTAMLQQCEPEHNLNPQTLNYIPNDISETAAFETAVNDLYARLRETVLCPPGCAGTAWAKYQEGVATYGHAAAIEALNRFARSQNGAA